MTENSPNLAPDSAHGAVGDDHPATDPPSPSETVAELAEHDPTPEPQLPQAEHDPTPEPQLPQAEEPPTPATLAPEVEALPAPGPAAPAAPSPAALAARLRAAPQSPSAAFGRVAEDGTVYVRAPDGEREVGSYPGATAAEALAYFARKYDDVSAQADLLSHRVTQTDLSASAAADALGKLRQSVENLRAVGDLVALAAKVENIATALEARRVVEAAERATAREAAKARREGIVAEAERICAQPEAKIQWKTSSERMRELLAEWKQAQRHGPKLDRESEQALWHRLSAARNSFDKLRRVHFAQLGSAQSEAKETKEELVAEAEALARSTDWGPTATSFKRLMDRWRQAGRASRADDDALWARFKGAQDAFFAAKDAVAAAENDEYAANLAIKEALLTQAQALIPVTDLESAKAALRGIQDKWDAAGKVPRADLERIEKAMRRVETVVREAEDKRWSATNPEAAARARSLVTQLESAVDKLRRDLAVAEAGGAEKRIATAREALAAREAWLSQARAGLAEFGG